MAAAHHPHILSCPTGGGVPLPRPGQAVFARAPAVDDENRLVYAPLGSRGINAYFYDSSTLAQYILEHGSDLAVTIRTAVGDPSNENINAAYRGLKDLADDPDTPARFRKRLASIRREGLDGLRSLVLGDELIYLGVMLADNLSGADREWWSFRGQLQVTTCVEGLATVFYDAESAGKIAADAFTPLTDAVWDLATNSIVESGRDQDGDAKRRIGVIVSAGVREVNILTDVTVYRE
jgi:hypothetical protein